MVGRPRITTKRFCTLDWCDKALYAKGVCKSHYRTLLRGREFTDPRIVNKDLPCSYDLCDRGADVKGYCKAHYMQLWSGGELRPIRDRRVTTLRPGQRNCKECGEWKSEDDFHNGSRPGSKQSRCKPCYNERIRGQREAKRLAKQGLSLE